LATCGICSGGAIAVAAEQVVMPFACDIERGRVTLKPSAPRSYPILGERTEQGVTSCRTLAGDCRAVVAHRFWVSCGGVRVPWIDIAAKARGPKLRSAWMDDGRMNVVLARPPGSPAPKCKSTPGLLGLFESGRKCLPWHTSERLVLPRGFAPVAEVGARIEAAAVEPMVTGSAPARYTDSVVGTGAEPIRPRAAGRLGIGAEPFAEPFAEAELTPAVAVPDAARSWVTVVREERPMMADAADVGRPSAWMIAAMLASVLSAMAFYAWRASPGVLLGFAGGLAGRRWRYGVERSARQLALLAQRTSSPGEVTLTNAADTVAALLAQSEAEVAALTSARPLREALEVELAAIRQRLAVARAAIAGGGGQAPRPAFRILVRDIERIRRIVESAAASLSVPREGVRMPRTRSEAFDVLGVNPDVSEAILKKITDALRMSWHPDHAKDEDDRQIRESRMKQINIASDLISAKARAS
jgi:hypothetical protein